MYIELRCGSPYELFNKMVEKQAVNRGSKSKTPEILKIALTLTKCNYLENSSFHVRLLLNFDKTKIVV